MIQDQQTPLSGKQQMIKLHRNTLLGRHPVFVPVTLISGCLVLCIASFYADSLFPLLSWMGIPSSLLCLLFALVLGISGILTSIISLIEYMDRHHLHANMFPNVKEGT